MKKFTALMVLFLATVITGSAFADENNPPVKMSKSEICHATDSSYYNRTKNFTAYETLDECLENGGRLPKNYQPKKES